MALVLCIDDDLTVARMIADVVRLNGHIAIVQTSSIDALANWARDPRLTVVITDYMMPKMDGLDVLTIFKETRPNVRRVLVTAAAHQRDVQLARADGTVQLVIEKPPTISDIQMAIAWL